MAVLCLRGWSPACGNEKLNQTLARSHCLLGVVRVHHYHSQWY